jgi:hypothetical protein
MGKEERPTVNGFVSAAIEREENDEMTLLPSCLKNAWS